MHYLNNTTDHLETPLQYKEERLLFQLYPFLEQNKEFNILLVDNAEFSDDRSVSLHRYAMHFEAKRNDHYTHTLAFIHRHNGEVAIGMEGDVKLYAFLILQTANEYKTKYTVVDSPEDNGLVKLVKQAGISLPVRNDDARFREMVYDLGHIARKRITEVCSIQPTCIVDTLTIH